MFRRLPRTARPTHHAAKPGSRARLLASLAGIPAGLRQTRRGSFLIMVVGTLALLSVITVIYVSVGRADRQTSFAAIKHEQRDEVPEQIRDYLAGIIAADHFDTLYLGERDENGDPIFRREAWDYPSTAYSTIVPNGTGELFDVITVGGNTDARFHFTPTGNGTGTDPWLASATPSLMNFDATGLSGETIPEDYYLERLDWLNLSNFAPDGAFVNLANLRGESVNGRSRGRFHATPWEMRGYKLDGKSVEAELTLFEKEPGTGIRSRLLDYGDTAKNSSNSGARPAEFGARQRWLVHPDIEPDLNPDHPDYLLYQYADADGDGILDSRWIELVEDRDPNDDVVSWILDKDSRIRYFVAVRAVDLSGRVNINSATDSTLAPFGDALHDLIPYGLNPSAIDVRRLLTLEDSTTDTRAIVGYSDHIQPNHPRNPDATDPENYQDYDTTNADNNAYFSGEKAYDAIRMVLDTGVMPQPGYFGLFILTADGVVDREFSLTAGTFNPYWDPYWKLSGTTDYLQPSNYYTLFAGFGPDGGAGYTSGGGSIVSGLGRSFGIDSLFDLLAFNGVNNDQTRSPLEVALSGRGDPNIMVDSILAARFGPLRDNRTTDIERTRGEWIMGPGGGYTFYDEAKAAIYTDVRQYLTTISGGRPIMPTRISADPNNADQPDPAALALDRSDTKRTIKGLFASGTRSQSLYKLYADALAPYTDNQTAPGLNHWDVASFETNTLYYGYRGPYLALQTAGFLAVNMNDAYDNGNTSTKRTLIFRGDQSFRTGNNLYKDPTGDRPVEYPWKLLDLDDLASGDPHPINPRLYEQGALGMPDAINVFGIEAQPFITEAASFMMYTDTPHSSPNSGDPDYPRDLDGDGVDDVNLNYRPTINGSATEGNPDCLFEMLAFQIHNPFDETISLGGTNDGSNAHLGQYYIQYGDDYYKLAKVDSAGEEVAGSISISPGDSKTFYVLSANPDRILERLNNALDPDDTVDVVNDWIDEQLSSITSPDPLRIGAFDRTTGDVFTPSGSFNSLQTGAEADRKVIRLWRIEKPEEDPSGGFQIAGGLDETLLNDPANDALIDRMRDPSPSPALDRQLPLAVGQDGEIAGAEIGQEPPKDPFSVDNQGLTITRYASLRRRDDPRANAVATVPRGALPAYCLETKSQLDTDSQNKSYDDGGSSSELDSGDFQGSKGAKTLRALLAKQSRPGLTNKLVRTVATDPAEKRGDPRFNIPNAEIGNNLASIPFDGGMVGGFYEPPLYVEPHLNNDKFEVTTSGISTMRVADLLLPLGIGPHQIPDTNYTGGEEDIEWTTLSEALAFALAYEEPSVSDSQSVYTNMFYDPAGIIEPLLDRASLRFDAFVPFFDDGADGLFDPTVDVRWGLGVPAAANIFDAVTTLPPKFGSIATLTHGQININTAPREVLRVLPGLSPTDSVNPDGSPNGWMLETDPHNRRSDIATTLAAYRDRIAMFPRDMTGAEPMELLNFRDNWRPDFTVRDLPPPPGEAPGTFEAEFAGDNGRWGNTGVMGIREGLGIRSLGEIAFLRDWGYAPDVGGYALPHDIDRLGYDQRELDQEGMDSITYGSTHEDDQIEDDYDERLAIANAVMASSSVRSDVFAVWFIVHGYKESDVKGLADADIMVPSVARRFVMVVDRSNVTEPGQKPKILLFKEVPL